MQGHAGRSQAAAICPPCISWTSHQSPAIALSNADQNTWTKFPIPTGVYTQLEEITLSGFRISKDIDPDTLPTLSRLKIIRYESCDLGQTDVWLLRCNNYVICKSIYQYGNRRVGLRATTSGHTQVAPGIQGVGALPVL